MGNRESEPQYTVATIRILKALPCGLYLPGLGGDGLKEPGEALEFPGFHGHTLASG
jgi:hypothetical protein